MNCEHLQESLYDYLDDILSPAERGAVQKHLDACSVCGQAVQRELLLARTLSDRFRQAVGLIALDPNAQRAMARTVQRRVTKCQRYSSFSFWRRLAMPFAAATLVLAGAIWLGRQVISEPTRYSNAPFSLAGGALVPIHFSYPVPHYIFQREGTMIVDALTYDTNVADGALLASK